MRYQSQDYAEQYAAEYHGGFSFKAIRSRAIAHREITCIKQLVSSSDPTSDSVLDIPCGTGKLGGILQRSFKSIVAADVSEDMMRLAKDQYGDGPVDFRVEDATQLAGDYSDTTWVVCLRLFQRLEKPTRVAILEEFAKTGAKHLVVSYSYGSAWQTIRKKIRALYDVEKNWFSMPSSAEIDQELRAAGFNPVKSRYVIPGLSSEKIIRCERVGAGQ